MSKFLQLLAQFGPLILMINPATAAIAPLVIHAISEAQTLQVSGADKKEHALLIIEDGVNIAHQTHVKGFEDPVLVMATVGTAIDTVVGVVKVIDGTKVAADPVPATV